MYNSIITKQLFFSDHCSDEEGTGPKRKERHGIDILRTKGELLPEVRSRLTST